LAEHEDVMRALALLTCLGLIIALGWLGVRPWLAAPDVLAAPKPGSAVVEPVAGFRAPEDTETDYGPFLDRPLFSAARRPPPPVATGVPVAEPANDLLLGRYEVAGVLMLGAGPVAMLRDEDGRLIRIRVGDRIAAKRGEADVIEITLDALTFRRGDDTVSAPVRQEGTKTE
ncbi:MAG: hypothetical protein AAF360_16595, partial [Pseudomonadota bacterium]